MDPQQRARIHRRQEAHGTLAPVHFDDISVALGALQQVAADLAYVLRCLWVTGGQYMLPCTFKLITTLL